MIGLVFNSFTGYFQFVHVNGI